MRTTVERHLARSAAEGELRGVLRDACADARARGVQVEELIVLFKRTFMEISAGRREPTVLTRHPDLDDLISACMEEYYR